ncbi:MAG: BPTD_3080 family restriction endonuclease [Candidatus Dormibacteria bacterium]
MSNPIISSPYDPPGEHFELGPHGPTGRILPGRRPSESFIPIPLPRKGRSKSVQQSLDFDPTGERRERNTLVNDVRFEVDRWRARNYPGVTAVTRKLLRYWASRPPEREEPVFFCQREAAETAIFLAEVAGRHAEGDLRGQLASHNQEHNSGLPRVGLKMATGTGKTVVMAMLIAWQTLNKVVTPSDSRFAKRFLVVTPGITIRDRLRVLRPEEETNYYRERDLVPADLWEALLQAQIEVTNYHTFLLRDANEIQGVAANTRKLLLAGKVTDPFRETPYMMAARVLRDLGGRGKGEVVVLNDEAHHCYQDRPLGEQDEADSEARERNEGARVWFRGLHTIHRRVGIKTIYDLSATPFYLHGSGYNEGYIFPWVVSDFSLMDAIESGIVKVPRVPVDDDAMGDQVAYLRLWDYVGDKLPKRQSKQMASGASWVPPEALEGALQSLYRSYETAFGRYEKDLAALGEPPPVFIVICPNTVVSKLVYDWIAGGEVELPDGTTALRTGELQLLSNVVDGRWAFRQRTVLIDSAQLESGEAMSAEFKKAATREVEVFKSEYRRRNPAADVDKLTDEDLLREVMNTVGKPGKLGEQVRGVVSVSMLTEGWDANTVTHILGIRRFGSQLLCEQVVGRGLRRRSYATDEDLRLEPEYAEVYGVPFAFIPTDRELIPQPPRPPAVIVEALAEREALRIEFPKLDGYRVEIPDGQLSAAFGARSHLHVDQSLVALWTKTEGIVGEAGEQDLDRFRHARPQEVAFRIARTLLRRFYPAHEGVERPWLFPRLVDICREWLASCVEYDGTAKVGMLLLAEGTNRAAEKVFGAIVAQEGKRPEILQPLLRRFDPEGSTDDVSFATRKVVIEATKSHVNRVVLDGPKGNSWEERMAGLLERHPLVTSYVKNDHLGFGIPYVHAGQTHEYRPDFLVRLQTDPGGLKRTLIVEVSGGRKAPGPTSQKADTARYQWCAAVNNHGGFGRWAYTEIKDMDAAAALLDKAIADLYADGPVAGLVVRRTLGE